jgi:hypothetical protein
VLIQLLPPAAEINENLAWTRGWQMFVKYLEENWKMLASLRSEKPTTVFGDESVRSVAAGGSVAAAVPGAAP